MITGQSQGSMMAMNARIDSLNRSLTAQKNGQIIGCRKLIGLPVSHAGNKHFTARLLPKVGMPDCRSKSGGFGVAALIATAAHRAPQVAVTGCTL